MRVERKADGKAQNLRDVLRWHDRDLQSLCCTETRSSQWESLCLGTVFTSVPLTEVNLEMLELRVCTTQKRKQHV